MKNFLFKCVFVMAVICIFVPAESDARSVIVSKSLSEATKIKPVVEAVVDIQPKLSLYDRTSLRNLKPSQLNKSVKDDDSLTSVSAKMNYMKLSSKFTLKDVLADEKIPFVLNEDTTDNWISIRLKTGEDVVVGDTYFVAIKYEGISSNNDAMIVMLNQNTGEFSQESCKQAEKEWIYSQPITITESITGNSNINLKVYSKGNGQCEGYFHRVHLIRANLIDNE